ncbi:MAG: endonuclease V [Actinomycetota bacterium]
MSDVSHWPSHPSALRALQDELGALRPQPWQAPDHGTVGGCFVCFERGGSGRGTTGDPGWAAATVMAGARVLGAHGSVGAAGAPYLSGFLAAREGPLLEAAVAGLETLPDVLLVNATGRDHPRRAGLALHLGWVCGVPTVGVTHRPLSAAGEEPGPQAGSQSPLVIEGDQVGWWVRTRTRARPVAVSTGWRTDADTALRVIRCLVPARARTPEPIRQARRLARTARSQSG